MTELELRKRAQDWVDKVEAAQAKYEKETNATHCGNYLQFVEAFSTLTTDLPPIGDGVKVIKELLKTKKMKATRIQFESMTGEFEDDAMRYGCCPQCLSVPTPTSSLCDDCKEETTNE